jgi:Hypervirulence associated proteins TUDOR domain
VRSSSPGRTERNKKRRTRKEPTEEIIPMKKDFKVGDHVEWNSEAGHVRGTIKKKISSAITFKGYTVHASEEEPQYLIKSDTTDHLAMHKGSALKKLKS